MDALERKAYEDYITNRYPSLYRSELSRFDTITLTVAQYRGRLEQAREIGRIDERIAAARATQ